ncbi:hypothetical protein KM043_008448 [Ampulex compressa]|nr:hypothetical protein KM043_008448 [Ampulex compressa]
MASSSPSPSGPWRFRARNSHGLRVPPTMRVAHVKLWFYATRRCDGYTAIVAAGRECCWTTSTVLDRGGLRYALHAVVIHPWIASDDRRSQQARR